MGRFFKYAVAQLATSEPRGERLNVAIVVLDDEHLDVRLPKSLDKIRAISAALHVDEVRASLERMSDTYSYILADGVSDPEERLKQLAEFAPVSFSPIGEFTASSDDEYNRFVHRLLGVLVEPEPAPQKASKRKATKLFADVKSAFKAERVLARRDEGLETHRIVTHHKIAEGLSADLLLKNGSFHVVQTVDASSKEASIKKVVSDVAVSALVFEQARMSFGDNGAKSNLVYKASSSLETLISPSLEAAEHQGAKLVNWESRDDRVRFIVELSSLAEPLSDVGRRSSVQGINASLQPKFRLN